MSDLSDAELLDLLRDPERRSYGFNLLVRQYQRRLYAFVRRMVTDHEEAQDILQNAFVKAWKGLDDFRGDAQLFSWLYRITHNECLDHLRRQRRRPFLSDAKLLEQQCRSLDDADQFSGDEIERRLQRAVMRLPEKQRAVFTMKYFQALTYEQISAITGTSVGALKSSYHIAVKKIEEHVLSDRTSSAPDRHSP